VWQGETVSRRETRAVKQKKRAFVLMARLLTRVLSGESYVALNIC